MIKSNNLKWSQKVKGFGGGAQLATSLRLCNHLKIFIELIEDLIGSKYIVWVLGFKLEAKTYLIKVTLHLRLRARD